MVRVIVGSAAAALAMLVVGFLIHATPLNNLGTGSLLNDRASALQTSLKDHLPYTGTYRVPDPDTAEQTALYGTGPIATIHFNAGGHAANDGSKFLSGLILNFIVAFLIGFGLTHVGVQDFASRARLVVPFAFAAAIFIHIGRPIYLHHDWNNAIFSMVVDGLALAVGGLVVAWFLPHHNRQQTIFSGPTRLRKSGDEAL
jgi:hypothetical protein